ncbi:MAG: hypothetical protein OXF07_14395 [Rhodobacter sp.]|nr:hypothetical protein [Rhodobacter sp.]MCY4168798.1 hypothetical protein [Rhodobacter sp.]
MKRARGKIPGRAGRQLSRVSFQVSRAARPGPALDWGRQRYVHLGRHFLEAETLEAWVRTNAERLGWGKSSESSSLEHLEQVLTEIVSAVLQESGWRSRIAVSAAVGKLGGVAVTGGITGLVTNFGVASTGTAIASLSGAAATTAKLYWIGSLVGLGVAGGGLMLAGGGLGAGVAVGALAKRKTFGKRRSENDLEDHERAIIFACGTLVRSVREQLESGQEPSPAEMRLFAEHALIPLAHQINLHWDMASLRGNGKSRCQPFNRKLAVLQRRRLDRCRKELERIKTAMIAADRC